MITDDPTTEATPTEFNADLETVQRHGHLDGESREDWWDAVRLENEPEPVDLDSPWWEAP